MIFTSFKISHLICKSEVYNIFTVVSGWTAKNAAAFSQRNYSISHVPKIMVWNPTTNTM